MSADERVNGDGAAAGRLAGRWADASLRRFVDDARVQLALLLRTDGRALAQHGFTRSVDAMSACALAAGIHASATALGRLVEGTPFGALHVAGRERQLYLGPVATPGATLVLLAVFDRETSLGLVQLYFRELQRALADAAPADLGDAGAGAASDGGVLASGFERELARNLEALFGRG